jgi:hypothetical protein
MLAKMSEKQFALINTSLAAVLTEPHTASREGEKYYTTRVYTLRNDDSSKQGFQFFLFFSFKIIIIN